MSTEERNMDELAERLRGEVRISVSKTMRDKAEESLRWAVVIKLSNGKDFNLQGLAGVLKRAWNFVKGVSFVSTRNNIALVKFDNKDKLLKVLDGGPWTFDGATVMIRRWLLESTLELMEFETLKIWVQLHNIPMDMLMDEVAVEIAEVAGKVRKRANPEAEVMRRRFVRYQVEINIYKPLSPGCFIDGWDGVPKWVAFKYERLPFFCRKCGAIAHKEATCKAEVQSQRVGAWLRAESENTWEPEKEGTSAGEMEAGWETSSCTVNLVGDNTSAGPLPVASEIPETAELAVAETAMTEECRESVSRSIAEHVTAAPDISDEQTEKNPLNKGKMIVCHEAQGAGWASAKSMGPSHDQVAGLLFGESDKTSKGNGVVTSGNANMKAGPKRRKEKKINPGGVRHQALKHRAVLPKQAHGNGLKRNEQLVVKDCLEEGEAMELTISQFLTAAVAKRPRRGQ